MDRRPVTPAPVVAVVGAGLAGLVAGVELQRRGARVTLIERSRLLGGRATSFVVDGVEVDNGQHVFLGCCTEFLDLAARLGLAGRVRLQERFDARVYAPGRRPARLRAARLPAPWHLAAGLLGYAELGWRDKLRLTRAMLAWSREPSPPEGEGRVGGMSTDPAMPGTGRRFRTGRWFAGMAASGASPPPRPSPS